MQAKVKGVAQKIPVTLILLPLTLFTLATPLVETSIALSVHKMGLFLFNNQFHFHKLSWKLFHVAGKYEVRCKLYYKNK